MSADISGLILQMELSQPLRLVCLSLSVVIYTNGWIHFSRCSAPLVLFLPLIPSVYSSSLSMSPTLHSSSGPPPFSVTCGEDDILLQPPRRPLCCEESSFLTARGQTVQWFIPPALAQLQRAEADSSV